MKNAWPMQPSLLLQRSLEPLSCLRDEGPARGALAAATCVHPGRPRLQARVVGKLLDGAEHHLLGRCLRLRFHQKKDTRKRKLIGRVVEVVQGAQERSRPRGLDQGQSATPHAHSVKETPSPMTFANLCRRAVAPPRSVDLEHGSLDSRRRCRRSYRRISGTAAGRYARPPW